MRINVRDARRNLKDLLDRAAAGEEITILRRGKPIARLVPPASEERRALPRLGDFRASIKIKGQGLSQTVVAARDEERY